jgi:hypothetical protein
MVASKPGFIEPEGIGDVREPESQVEDYEEGKKKK